MKAVTQDTYGAAAVLELRDIDGPEIAVDEVLVHVHAAGVGRGVWHLMTGLPLRPGARGQKPRGPRTRGPGGGRRDA